MKRMFIGDVHGKFARYKTLIKNHQNSIQVGDMGVGFHSLGTFYETRASGPPYNMMKEGNHRFIRGNHDNPGVCKTHTQWIPDGFVEDNMMFIGGAVSIDKAWRTEGIDWWPDEELSYARLNEIFDIYEVVKPEILVTHDCPEFVANVLCEDRGYQKINIPSSTRVVLESMRAVHKVKLHIFGHWHLSFDKVIDGTRYVCLNELETVTVDTENFEVDKTS